MKWFCYLFITGQPEVINSFEDACKHLERVGNKHEDAKAVLMLAREIKKIKEKHE